MQTSTKPVQESAAWEILPSSSSQIRYGSVDWSFDSKLSSVKPPHYHGSLLRTSRPRRRYMVIWNAKPFGSSQHSTTLPHESAEEWPHSDSLNHQFIAVKMAEDVLGPYELDVGFSHSIMPDLALDKSYFSRMRLSADVDEEEVQSGRSQWAALARDLIGDIHLSMGISTPDLEALSSLEYDSEPSTDSDLPRTPTQKGTFPDVEVHHHSPVLNIRGLPPPKALNGSARTFTPTSGPPSKYSYPLISPSPDSRSGPGLGSSPTPVNFTFPAINGNYQYLPQGLKKDDQGFYTSVTPPSSPCRARLDSRLSSTRLPHFLSDAQSRSRKASRTRVIVDQMKATPLPNKKGRSQNHSESPSREAESPLSPETSSSPSGAGDTTSSGSTDSEDQDPGATFITDTRITARNNGWKELSSAPTPSVKAPFPTSSSTAVRVSFHATTTYPTVPFVVQAPAPPFYPIPRASGYPYSCVAPPTSWVPITVPAYPSGVYTRPVIAHAAW